MLCVGAGKSLTCDARGSHEEEKAGVDAHCCQELLKLLGR